MLSVGRTRSVGQERRSSNPRGLQALGENGSVTAAHVGSLSGPFHEHRGAAFIDGRDRLRADINWGEGV